LASVDTLDLGATERRAAGRSLARQITSRLLWAIPTLIFISLLTFVIGEMAPGDAATVIAGEKASASAIENIRERLGLNRPVTVRYVEFVKNAAVLDFGQSWFPPYKPVRETLVSGMGLTGLLAVCAIVVASFFGVMLGCIAAIWHNRWPDRVAVTFSTLGICIPNFVLAPVFIFLFALSWKLLPETWPYNWDSIGIFDRLRYLIMPVTILSLRPAAVITRLTRAAMIDTLSQDYIRTAFAKGVPFWRVIWKHAFLNSLVPIVTAIGTTFGFLLTGSFILETAFRIPGLGLKSIQAIYQGDFPVVQATVLLFAVLFILVNLIVDVLLPLLDPRIRSGAA
jgi:ABC-type dipeptide/oligopeptide/nickel transport system permease component